ncbi:unnamed protein product [Trichobilharzia regenti]|nr:unnamed protein product [Trichobilharzia regenti]
MHLHLSEYCDVGLKPVPATVPIRPAVVTASQNKNPLDALDSTLSNLASSLGGQPTWGTTNIKKKPLSESGKPTVRCLLQGFFPMVF